MAPLPADTVVPEITTALRPSPRIHITTCSRMLYRRFRVLEPTLASCLDDTSDTARLDILSIALDGEPCGVVSLVTRRNAQKTTARSLYGRVDLVIVHESRRNLGLGRVLMLAGLIQLLKSNSGRLYSISCLAAHPAIQQVLEQVGFHTEARPNCNFKHEETSVDEQGSDDFAERLIRELSAAARRTNYRIRQASAGSRGAITAPSRSRL